MNKEQEGCKTHRGLEIFDSKVNLSASEEPSDIIWENLSMSKKEFIQRWFAFTCIGICIMLIIMVSVTVLK